LHILYIFASIKLQFKITNITEKNKIHKTNSHKTRRQLDIIGAYA